MNHTHFLPSERTSLFFLESTCKAPCRAERSFQFLGRRAGQKRRRGLGWAAAQGPARKGKRDVLWPLQEGLGPRARTMTQSSRIAQTSAIAPLFPSHLWLRTCPSAPSPGLTMHPIFISVRSLPGPGSALSSIDIAPLSQSPWPVFSSSKKNYEGVGEGGRDHWPALPGLGYLGVSRTVGC